MKLYHSDSMADPGEGDASTSEVYITKDGYIKPLKDKMKRIHILLEESDYEKLRKLSYETRKPISKIIRELVEQHLSENNK